MNSLVLLSGGSGKRFGTDKPKQYMDLCGKPVIDYVIEAALEAKTIDQIIIVMDNNYMDYVKKFKSSKINIVSNGKERINSVKNALDFINENFDCDRVIITQAVSPFITSNIIDEYINLLDNNDCVTTASRCVGEIFNKNNFVRLDRDDFYFCQSPEAFKFKDLYNSIDVESKYSELIYHYENAPKIYYYLDFKNNIKLTYKDDLEYCKYIMENKK